MEEVTPGAAVLLFHPRAEKPRLTRLEPHLAIHDPLLAPFRLLGNYPGFDELPKVSAKDIVFL
jgi:hypothetical protein